MPAPSFSEFMAPAFAAMRYKLHPRQRVVARDDDMSAYPWTDCEWLPTEDSVSAVLEVYKQFEEKERWYKDAERQVYVQDAKKEIRNAQPKVYEMKKVALTISPPPDYSTVEHVQKIVAIAVKTSAIKGGVYVFEQRSTGDETEHGWHIHMSVDTTVYPAKVKQYVKQMLDSRGYHFTNPKAYFVTYDDGGFRDKYMMGEKNHADKDPKVAKDRILRERYGLQDFYEIQK